MGHSHGHLSASGEGKASAVLSPEVATTRRRARWILSSILVPLGLLTVLAMVMLWPSNSRQDLSLSSPYAAAPGVSFDTGTIVEAQESGCNPSNASSPTAGSGEQAAGSSCLWAITRPDHGGSNVKVAINPDVAKSHAVQAGDSIRYLNLSGVQGAVQGDTQSGGEGASAQSSAPLYVFVEFVRTVPITILAVVYAAVVILVARWRGLRALIGLAGAYVVLTAFILPGLVEGKPPLLLALVGSTVIMIGVLYFAHGFSARTSTALLGTMFGLVITALLAAWATDAANLVGVGNHDAATLVNISPNISISGIILCGLIISGLGVLNDVTITQSSAVWELHELAPHTSARQLFSAAMRIGRDHIASTVYTIAFAYAGAALPVLMIVMLYDRPLVETLTSAELSEEVIRTLVGSIGLVLAIPVTTAIAVLVVKATGLRGSKRRSPGRRSAAAGNTPSYDLP
ncbi:YibE/F family protein [Pseudarthrobacter sp. J1738]|uniref:YibE/F family protein n=1 Tax=unclassified Pseudarthrobacter TaxID=2647000 RepID=UPI003D29F4F7